MEIYLKNKTMEIYDDSVFNDGIIFDAYDRVGVSNRADQYLLERLSKITTKQCDPTVSISLNPPISCLGVNVYSMDVSRKQIQEFYRFNTIYVVTIEYMPFKTLRMVTLEEFTENSIYDLETNSYDRLTPFEAAIMLKWYSYKNHVFITQNLYHYTKKEFRDERNWFQML